MVFEMEGRMVTDKIQCVGLGLMRSKRNFRASWVVCVYECFYVLDKVWWSLFTTSCQEGFSSFTAVLHCRQCSSLRAMGLTSGENQSKIQPFRLKLNGFKESGWWAFLINGRTFMISENALCSFIPWTNLGQLSLVYLHAQKMYFICHFQLLPYIFLLPLPPLCDIVCSLKACSPSVSYCGVRNTTLPRR